MLNYSTVCHPDSSTRSEKMKIHINRIYVRMHPYNGQTVSLWICIGQPLIEGALYGFHIKKLHNQ
jgi:hypothetical protein